MVLFQVITVGCQDANAFGGDVQGVIDRNAIVTQQFEGMRFGGIEQTMKDNRFAALYNHFTHEVCGVFFHETQRFGKADAVTAE